MADQPPKPLEVRADPELSRLAVGLHQTGPYRVWLVARHGFGQPGWVDKDTLWETLHEAGILQTRRHFNRLLQAGQGTFWQVSAQGRVYLRSYVKVSLRLTEQALRSHPALVATNIPGVRAVYLPVNGSLGEFKAQVYAGWLTYREGPTIARSTLCTLFNCTADTLRQWEKTLGERLEVLPTYAQCGLHPRDEARVADYLPEHSYTYATRRGQIRFRWRLPNTYRPHQVRQHGHKGQSRKARAAAAEVAWGQPVESRATPPASRLVFDRSHRPPKRYYATAEALQRSLKRGARGEPPPPNYVWLGQPRGSQALYELSLDGELRTTLHERLPLKQEIRWWRGYDQWVARQRTG